MAGYCETWIAFVALLCLLSVISAVQADRTFNRRDNRLQERIKRGRVLQNVFVHLDYDGDGRPPSSPPPPSPPPPSPPPPSPQPPSPPPPSPPPPSPPPPTPPAPAAVTSVTCASATTNTNSAMVDVVVPFNIETDTADADESVVNEMARIVEQVMVSRVADEQCPGNVRRLNRKSRRLEVVEVSSEHGDRCSGTCEASGEGSSSCTMCEGIISVQFTDSGANSSPDDVTNSVHSTLQAGMGWYTGIINESDEMKDSDTTATHVEYTGPTTDVVAGVDEEVIVDEKQAGGSGSEITPGGWVVIALISFFAICLAVIVYLLCKSRRQETKKGGSSETDSRATSMDDNSYLSTNFQHPGQAHSRLDVHQCNSGLCRACHPHLTQEDIAAASRIHEETKAENAEGKEPQQGETSNPNGIRFLKAEPVVGPPVSLLDLDISEAGDSGISSEGLTGEEESGVDNDRDLSSSLDVEEDEESTDKALDLGLTEDDLNESEYILDDEMEHVDQNQEVPLGGDLDMSDKPRRGRPLWRQLRRGRKAKAASGEVDI